MKTEKTINRIFLLLSVLALTLLCMTGCGNNAVKNTNHISDTPTPGSALTAVRGTRDNTPVCLSPIPGTTAVYQNDAAVIDASNSSQGYIIVRYTGRNSKVKLQIVGQDQVTYTYNLKTGNGGADEVFPLSAGDGQYLINVYENISANQYATAFSQAITVTLADQFLPFLYPNQYVTFNATDQAVAKASELAYSADSDLDVVTNIYDYIISNITYDYDEAENVQSGYIPDVDEVLFTKKGICLDYAALMTAMLRSQRIPTRMEVGYAGTAYHAWISTYITDIGWVNGMIQFDGKDWSLMDPTFASTTSEKELKSFLNDSSNYRLKYIY